MTQPSPDVASSVYYDPNTLRKNWRIESEDVNLENDDEIPPISDLNDEQREGGDQENGDFVFDGDKGVTPSPAAYSGKRVRFGRYVNPCAREKKHFDSLGLGSLNEQQVDLFKKSALVDIEKLLPRLHHKIDEICSRTYSPEVQKKGGNGFQYQDLVYVSELEQFRRLVIVSKLKKNISYERLYKVASRFKQLRTFSPSQWGMSPDALLKYAAILEKYHLFQESGSRDTLPPHQPARIAFSITNIVKKYIWPESNQARCFNMSDESVDSLEIKSNSPAKKISWRQLGLPFSLSINVERQGFALLQKRKIEPLIGKGGSKNVKAAIYIPRNRNKKPSHAVEAIIKKDSIARKEIAHLKLIKGSFHHMAPYFHSEYEGGKDRKKRTSIIMERYEGNLRSYEGSLSLHDQIYLFCDTATGLQTLHEKGYVHGDMKPENVLVRREVDRFCACITDYDCLEPIQKSPDDPERKKLYWYGTPLYTAPEVWKDSRYKNLEAAEMYALGLTFLKISGELSKEVSAISHYIMHHQEPLMMHTSQKAMDEIQRMQRDLFGKLHASIQSRQDTLIGQYLRVLAGLIHPDPNQRWSMPQCQEEIKKLFD